MKNILLIFVLNFINTNFYSGEVTYKIILPEQKEIDESKYDKKIVEKAKKIAEERSKFEYVLTFNKTISKYGIKETLEKNETNEYKIAKKTFGSEEFYYNTSDNFFIKKTSSSELIKSANTLDWKIYSESKKIENFIVFKATKEVKYFSKGKEKKKIITAWYCPEIPFNFGPLNYAGLPGLIMEVNDNGMSYVAKKINLYKTKKNIIIPKGKTISQEEYSKKIRENSQF